MIGEPSDDRQERLRARLRQLILMRETGPKRAAWHAARARLIWRLHDELRQAEEPAADSRPIPNADHQSGSINSCDPPTIDLDRPISPC
jgi:hypothetical protein